MNVSLNTAPTIQFPPQILLDKSDTDPILTLFYVLGAMRLDWSQAKLIRHVKFSHNTIQKHLNLFKVDWKTLAPYHRISDIWKLNRDDQIKDLFYTSDNKIKAPSEIAEQFPEDILTLLYLYLRDKHLSAENNQLVEKFKLSIENMITSVDMKHLLTLAISEYEANPSPSWYKQIVDTIKDIESGKLKKIGNQQDGSRIIQIHLSKAQVQLLDAKQVDPKHFLDYSLKQYRESLKRSIRRS